MVLSSHPVYLFTSVFFGEYKRQRKMFIVITIMLLLFIDVLRLIDVIYNDPTWDFGVRKQIVLRMDSIFTGVLFAGISVYFSHLYDAMKPLYLYLISLIGVFLCAVYYMFAFYAGTINSSSFWQDILV
jgi:hypothetical protein